MQGCGHGVRGQIAEGRVLGEEREEVVRWTTTVSWARRDVQRLEVWKGELKMYTIDTSLLLKS